MAFSSALVSTSVSRSLSAVDASKFAMMALKGGEKSAYKLPLEGRENLTLGLL